MIQTFLALLPSYNKFHQCNSCTKYNNNNRGEEEEVITGETGSWGAAGGVETERRRVKLIQIQYLCMKISKTPQTLSDKV